MSEPETSLSSVVSAPQPAGGDETLLRIADDMEKLVERNVSTGPEPFDEPASERDHILGMLAYELRQRAAALSQQREAPAPSVAVAGAQEVEGLVRRKLMRSADNGSVVLSWEELRSIDSELARLRDENKTFRAAQRACADCDESVSVEELARLRAAAPAQGADWFAWYHPNNRALVYFKDAGDRAPEDGAVVLVRRNP